MQNNTQEITLREFLGPLAQFITNLMGKDGRSWLDAFNRFLRKEDAWISTKWKVWKIIQIGIKKSIDEKITTALVNGYVFQDNHDMRKDLYFFGNKLISPEEDMCFASVSPKELGLKKGFTLQQVWDSGRRQGLELCHPGDTLDIISGNNFQLNKGESIAIAMEPYHLTADVKKYGIVFWIGRFSDNLYHLGVHNGVPTTVFDQPTHVDNKFLFRIARNFRNS